MSTRPTDTDKLTAIVVVIPADPDQPIRRVTITGDSLPQYQALVGGGYIEAVPTIIGGVSLFVNEDGKMLDLPINERATRLCELFEGDYISGDAVVIGRPDNEGRTTGAPEWIVDRLPMLTDCAIGEVV